MKEIKLSFYDTKYQLPPNRTWVIAQIENKDSGRAILQSVFFEAGYFWENASDYAQRYQHAQYIYSQWKEKEKGCLVVAWCSGNLK